MMKGAGEVVSSQSSVTSYVLRRVVCSDCVGGATSSSSKRAAATTDARCGCARTNLEPGTAHVFHPGSTTLPINASTFLLVYLHHQRRVARLAQTINGSELHRLSVVHRIFSHCPAQADAVSTERRNVTTGALRCSALTTGTRGTSTRRRAGTIAPSFNQSLRNAEIPAFLRVQTSASAHEVHVRLSDDVYTRS